MIFSSIFIQKFVKWIVEAGLIISILIKMKYLPVLLLLSFLLTLSYR